MKRLTHSAGAFARRVQRGRARLWILVEGRSNDAPFYDRIAATLLESEQYEVRPVEQITLGGASAGGKRFALRLLEYWEDEDVLRQEAHDGIKSIAIVVDRDFDDLGLQRIDHPHLVYTRAADVESEVLSHVNLQKVTAAAYSLPISALPGVIKEDGAETLNEFGNLWFEWLKLRACACRLELLPNVRFGDKSLVNIETYGPLDFEKLDALWTEMRKSDVFDAEAVQALEATLEDIRLRDKLHLLIKGKWIEGYVWHLLRSVDYPRPASIRTDSLTRVGIGSLDFSGSWAEHYTGKFNALLERDEVAA